MKIQNTNIEFVAFENADVIATSGGYWFKMSDFAPGDWSVRGGAVDFYSSSLGKILAPVNSGGIYLGNVGLDKVYQLVCEKNSENLCYGVDSEALVVAEEVATGAGTQITTFAGILEWIGLYGNK